jgi:ABC-type transport system involved in cytochrome c biogenesis permease subunit
MTLTFDISLFWWSLVGFGLASALHVISLASGKKGIGIAATAVMAAATLALTAGIAVRSVRIGHLPVTNMFEYLSIFAWSAALFYFVFAVLLRQQVVGAFVAPVVFMLVEIGRAHV